MLATEKIQLFSLRLFMKSFIKIEDKNNKKGTSKEFINI